MIVTNLLIYKSLTDCFTTSEYPNSNLGWSPYLSLYKKKYSSNGGYFSRIFIKYNNIDDFIDNSKFKIDSKEFKGVKCIYLRLYFYNNDSYIDNALYNFNIKVGAVTSGLNDCGMGLSPDLESYGFNFNSSFTISDSYTTPITSNDILRGYIDLSLYDNGGLDFITGVQGIVIQFEDETDYSDLKIGKTYGVVFHSVESNFIYNRPQALMFDNSYYEDNIDKFVFNNYKFTIDIDESLSSGNYTTIIKDNTDYSNILCQFSGSSSTAYDDKFNMLYISGSTGSSIAENKIDAKFYFYIDNTLYKSNDIFIYKDNVAVKSNMSLEKEYILDVKFENNIYLTFFKRNNNNGSYINKSIHQSLIYDSEDTESLSIVEIMPEEVYFTIELDGDVLNINDDIVKFYMLRDGKNKVFKSYFDIKQLRPNTLYKFNFYDKNDILLGYSTYCKK